jgi:hypothetical protein
MAKKLSAKKSNKFVLVNQKKMEIWPSNQQIAPCVSHEPKIQQTNFTDLEKVNEGLVKAMLKLESDPKFAVNLMRGGCGTKLDNINNWKVPEADLIHARAISFFIKGLGFDQAVVDQCWGNIYRKGDYCMPHSHIRSRIAIVYLVDPGDGDPDFPIDGRFYFSDPRIEYACDIQDHCLTTYIMPDLVPGSMISFPGPIVHGVNPYNGDRPRITLSWNINRLEVPGKPPELR